MSAQDAHARQDHGAREQFAALLSGSVWPTVAMAVVATVVGAFFSLEAAWSAALGGLLVLGFFSLSLVVMRQTAHLEPTVVMAIVLATYTGKILALGLAVIACTVVWIGFEMRAFSRLRTLVAPGVENAPERSTGTTA